MNVKSVVLLGAAVVDDWLMDEAPEEVGLVATEALVVVVPLLEVPAVPLEVPVVPLLEVVAGTVEAYGSLAPTVTQHLYL